MRIDDFMPDYRLRETKHLAVAAGSDRSWTVARGLDLQEAMSVRALFAIRTLPDRLVGWLRRSSPPLEMRAHIDDIVKPGTGFMLLAEDPGREVVIGAVGKFWQPRIEWAQVTREGFKAFAEPGFGKLTWNLRVDPRAEPGVGGSWITIEVRVTATDDASWRSFRRYWEIIGRGSRYIRRSVLRTLERKLGAAPAREALALAGDAILPGARFQRTHATQIDARPEQVWPWLVQMGCRRAGWYSFDRLDNGGVASADHIVPELQRLALGDMIPARPIGTEAFAVLALEPTRALVLGSPSLRPGGGPDWGMASRVTWAFALEPIGDFATALAVRVRAEYRPSAKLAIAHLAVGAAHEIMEREQLRNLRRRSEGRA